MDQPAKTAIKKPVNKLAVLTLVLSLMIASTAIYIYANREMPVIDLSKVQLPVTEFYEGDKLVAKTEANDKRFIIAVDNEAYYVDRSKLLSILSKYTAVNSWHPLFPYQTQDKQINIDVLEGGKSKHILLGGVFVVYETGRNAWTIQNGEALLEEILNLERIPTQ